MTENFTCVAAAPPSPTPPRAWNVHAAHVPSPCCLPLWDTAGVVARERVKEETTWNEEDEEN